MIRRISETIRGINPDLKVRLALIATLGQYGEIAVDLLQQFQLSGFAHAVPIEPSAKIFGDRQKPENPPIFRHIAEPESRQPMSRQVGNGSAFEKHPALAGIAA